MGNLHVPHDPFVAGVPSHDRLEHLQQLLHSDDCDVVLDQVWAHTWDHFQDSMNVVSEFDFLFLVQC